MNQPRQMFTTTLLSDGTVLAAAGWVQNLYSEVYLGP